jgi:hypothetical protein
MSLAESAADTRPDVTRPHITSGNRSPFEAIITAAIRVASARGHPKYPARQLPRMA